MGREPLWSIIRLAAQAPTRSGLLSSNVRPRRASTSCGSLLCKCSSEPPPRRRVWAAPPNASWLQSAVLARARARKVSPLQRQLMKANPLFIGGADPVAKAERIHLLHGHFGLVVRWSRHPTQPRVQSQPLRQLRWSRRQLAAPKRPVRCKQTWSCMRVAANRGLTRLQGLPTRSTSRLDFRLVPPRSCSAQ